MYRPLASKTRHKCFISYHTDDEQEVTNFINTFDHDNDVFLSRGIGAGMAGDIIESDNDEYIKRRIRELYLRDSTVTVVMIGQCTWTRKFVDWEIGASLRNTPTSNRNGLLGIVLPSVAGRLSLKFPERLTDNLSTNGELAYARWMHYPTSVDELARGIEDAFALRTVCGDLADNSRDLMEYNKDCW